MYDKSKDTDGYLHSLRRIDLTITRPTRNRTIDLKLVVIEVDMSFERT